MLLSYGGHLPQLLYTFEKLLVIVKAPQTG